MFTKKASSESDSNLKSPHNKGYTHSGSATTQTDSSTHDIARKNKTKITVKFDAGFPNTLYLRGAGANLSWERGVPMKNVKADEWVWETDAPFTIGEFKVLVNDKQFENGENHPLKYGASISYTPNF